MDKPNKKMTKKQLYDCTLRMEKAYKKSREELEQDLAKSKSDGRTQSYNLDDLHKKVKKITNRLDELKHIEGAVINIKHTADAIQLETSGKVVQQDPHNYSEQIIVDCKEISYQQAFERLLGYIQGRSDYLDNRLNH